MRSGTHMVHYMIARHIGSDSNISYDISELDIDELNFNCNSDRFNLYVTHFESIELWTKQKLHQLNAVIKNRNIYVLFLDRIDFNEQVLSRAIMETFAEPNSKWKADSKKIKGKVRLKKAVVEAEYRNLTRIKYHNNLNKIPLTVHQKIYYEDVLENGLCVNGVDIPFVSDSNNSNNLAIIKNPSKKDSIRNYDEVLKWMKQFSEKYNKEWQPYIVWGEK